MLLGRLARRRTAHDDGSIAIMAAVIIPVVLSVIALALSTLVWGASETEVQRASDQAAAEAASSALLLDFPYASLNPLNAAVYPTLQKLAPAVPAAATVTQACQTIGNPIASASSVLGAVPVVPPTTLGGTLPLPGGSIGGSVSLPGVDPTAVLNAAVSKLPTDVKNVLSTLPSSCNVVNGPISPIPAVPATAKKDACDTASSDVSSDSAPYSTRFFGGSFGAVPNCLPPGAVPSGTTNGRVQVSFATESPLLGFPGTSVSVDNTTLTVPSGITAVQNDLAPLGVRLDTLLPNALCPSVTVKVDQPVKGIISGTSVPNGRATAKRVIKNAVVVPVFNGMTLASAQAQATLTAAGLGSVSTTVNGVVTTPALNLNSALLQPLQSDLLTALGKVDTAINKKLTQANAVVQTLNGVYNSVNVTGSVTVGGTTVGVNTAGSASVGNLDLLKCVRETVGDIFNPPTGDAATVDQVLKQAAAAGEPVNIIQVGVQSCAGATSATGALSCVQAAVGDGAAAALSAVTGLYDIPFLDITPTIVKDVGNGNYEAVPVHASQASGAFRATLVRSTTDPRYIP